MARTLNRVQLIGRLGGDPELRHTGAGLPVATFSIATNRQWPGKDGSLQEETEWHTIVAWDKLAQICSEHLTRGRLVYIEGRIHTRSWEANGQKQYKTEIVATDMLILDSRPSGEQQGPAQQQSAAPPTTYRAESGSRTAVVSGARSGRQASTAAVDDTDPDDLPF
jgi:single-strand DNA-binding protein